MASSSSTDVYGIFSSAEQAERAFMNGTLVGEGYDIVSFDFDASDASAFVKQVADCLEGQKTSFFQNQEHGQQLQDSPFHGTSPSLTPQSDSQLSLPSGTEVQSFMASLPQLFADDASTPSSCSNESSPMNLDQSELGADSGFANALGLLDNSYVLDGSMQACSPSLLFPEMLSCTAAGELFAPAPESLRTPELRTNESSLSSIVKATAQLSLGMGYPSPPEENLALHTASPVMLCIDSQGVHVFKPAAGPAPPNASMSIPERSYPSPFATPQKAAASLPSTNTKVGKYRPSRAAAAKRKSYREVSTSSVPSSPASSRSGSLSSACGSEQANAGIPQNAANLCQYGYRVLLPDNRGRPTISKWKCKICQTMVGRRPDLHRHYKTCVTKEKFYCIDVVHEDGSIWPGCGEMFSRRDACHRHLKKRFTEGRCIRKKPKEDQFRSDDEFFRKMRLYEDMVDDYEWRAALPAAEKNRLVRTALSQIKKDMF